ncbi:hypothetical protein O3Q52_17545 [Streptomyces sp. ActVer]|uniref:hypothetical protein n=1 Tax=Streptomyces sp. ActVer TaxID=3014558 RepID=UPI0022B47634|nr:hypothetical protein [Streptomyces sp. ActVer]MCZ4509970.1 hypothetical protein [Streptomyces sp. ActVer]
MANPNQEARTSQGRYTRTLENAERDTEAARLHAHGWTDGMIAKELNYPSTSAARDGRKKALAEIQQAPAAEIIALEVRKLDMELVRLEQLERDVRKVLERAHVTVSHGKVITTANPDTGVEEPLLDDGPVLQAADRLVKIEDARRRNAERRAKLLGLDAEQKVSVAGSVKYEVVGVDPADLA